jgi:hypothetical protein
VRPPSQSPSRQIPSLSFMRFWADRLAALADREPNGIPFGVLLRIDAREVVREAGTAMEPLFRG